MLAVVSDEDGDGYDVVRRLRAAPSRRSVTRGLRALRRLYSSGALRPRGAQRRGPHRKDHGVKAQARPMLEAHRKDWQDFAGAVGRLLKTEVVR